MSISVLCNYCKSHHNRAVYISNIAIYVICCCIQKQILYKNIFLKNQDAIDNCPNKYCKGVFRAGWPDQKSEN